MCLMSDTVLYIEVYVIEIGSSEQTQSFIERPVISPLPVLWMVSSMLFSLAFNDTHGYYLRILESAVNSDGRMCLSTVCQALALLSGYCKLVNVVQ
jgi:hypothetical protein